MIKARTHGTDDELSRYIDLANQKEPKEMMMMNEADVLSCIEL